MDIGREELKKINNTIAELLLTYQGDITEALDSEGTVVISLPIKITQEEKKLDVKIGISFIQKRTKDSIGFTFTDQQKMFEES